MHHLKKEELRKLVHRIEKLEETLGISERDIMISSELRGAFMEMWHKDTSLKTIQRLIDLRTPVIKETELIKEAKKEGISRKEAQKILEKMRRRGDIFEPKKGFIRRI